MIPTPSRVLLCGMAKHRTATRRRTKPTPKTRQRRRTPRAATPVALPDGDRLMSIEEICQRQGQINRSTLYRGVKAGRFPPLIQFSANRRGLRWSTYVRWLDEQEAQARRHA